MGTKALWRKDYELIAANRSYFATSIRSEISICSSARQS